MSEGDDSKPKTHNNGPYVRGEDSVLKSSWLYLQHKVPIFADTHGITDNISTEKKINWLLYTGHKYCHWLSAMLQNVCQ